MRSLWLAGVVATLALGAVIPVQTFSYAQKEARKEVGPQIVKKVLKVDWEEEEIFPPNLVVTASGSVPTGGYDKVKLVRVVYATPPEDGIQDYILLATPPVGPAIQVVSQVKATDRWKGYTKDAPWLKGIRVHGVDDGVVVKMFAKGK